MTEKKLQVKILRCADVGDSMIGRLFVMGAKHPVIWTLEDSWKGNQRSISCIPLGTYSAKPHNWENATGRKFQSVWEILNVPDRSAILIHGGNTKQDTQGCVLVGLATGTLGNSPAILHSNDALKILRDTIGNRPFDVEVASIWDKVRL